MLKPAAKPRLEVSNRAEPFYGRDGVGDSVKSPVGNTVVGVGIQYYVIITTSENWWFALSL